jgi:hypothetical protein
MGVGSSVTISEQINLGSSLQEQAVRMSPGDLMSISRPYFHDPRKESSVVKGLATVTKG